MVVLKLAMSAIDSVKAQKNGGLSAHPIGKLSEMPIRFCPVASGGRTTASSKAASSANGMR